MLGFIIGLFVGGTIGFFGAVLVIAGGSIGE